MNFDGNIRSVRIDGDVNHYIAPLTIINHACCAQDSEMGFPWTYNTIFLMCSGQRLSCESLYACRWFSSSIINLILFKILL